MENNVLIKNLLKSHKEDNNISTLTIENGMNEEVSSSVASTIKDNVNVMLTRANLDCAEKNMDVLTSEEMLAIENSYLATASTDIYSRISSELPTKMANTIDKNTLSVESATGATLVNISTINKVFNAVPAKQDEFGEGFFPTVIKKPNETGIAIESTVPSYYKSWDGEEKSKVSVVDLNRDPSFLITEDNRVYPIWDASLSEFLDANNRYIPQGSKVESAPILFNNEIDILEISTNDANISGSLNTTRALSPSIVLERLYGSNADNSVKFMVDVSGYRFSTATPTAEGKNEDFQINFEAKTMKLPLSVFLTAAGANVYTGPEIDYTVEIDIKAMIKGNIEYGTIRSYPSETKIVKICDVNGDVVPDGAELTAILAKIAGIEFKSFTLIAYEDNGDIVNEGRVFTTDNEKDIYDIPYRMPNSVKGSIANLYDNNDVTKLASLVTNTGLTVSAYAVDKLFKVIDETRWAVKYNTGSNLKGHGNHYVSPYFSETTLDLSNSVNNGESYRLEASLTSNLRSAIKVAALAAAEESGLFSAVNSVYNGGRKLRCTVGTDRVIAQYLKDADGSIINITDDIELQIVSTDNIKVKNKIIGAFTPSVDRGQVDFFSLGFTGWSPTIVVDTDRTINNRSTKCITAFPQYKHHNLTNIMFVIDVAGLEKLIKKV